MSADPIAALLLSGCSGFASHINKMRKSLKAANSLLQDLQIFVGQVVLTVAAIWGLVRFMLWLLHYSSSGR
jgi:hypothetical protein